MKAVLSFLASIATVAAAGADQRSSPPAPPANYHSVSSMIEIPANVLNALKNLCGGCVFADIGAPWSPTDALNGLPQRRIVEAGRTNSTWVIRYDRGGIGRVSYTAVFSLTPSIHLAAGSSCLPTREKQCYW
jgi:hypothetical protein